jgi:hypothetical protein
MSGWRVWFAFEARPGVTKTSLQDMTDYWRGLAESCLNHEGKLDAKEFDRWVELIVEHSHLRAEA